MKQLLHCVFHCDGTELPQERGRPMEMIHDRGLAVAATPWEEEAPPIRLARLLEYQTAIARLHATRTVVPLRFGCVLESPSQVVKLLEERRAEFEQLLCDLEGLAEVGLRIWWKPPPQEPALGSPGARYLAAARERHAGLTLIEERFAREICGSLDGLYARQKREAGPAAEGRLLSLHFLVARGAAEDFRRRAGRLSLGRETKLLATGPWPPYNFVDHA